MLITTLLEAHHDARLPRAERIINDINIGDAYLYRHHPLHRNVRDVYWELGYRFDPNDFCYLFQMPVFSLDLILKERKIPVRDTVTPLHDLVRRFPQAVYTDISFAYPANHLVHHCAHCVGDHVTEETIASWEKLGKSSLAVLRALICESFANASDALTNMEAHRDGEVGRTFFAMNCVIDRPAEECAPFAQLVERMGMKLAIQILALFFLFRNLLAEEIDAEFLGDALQAFGIDFPAERAGELLPFFPSSYLTPAFRINTTTRYFRYVGFEFDDLLSLYDFDLLEIARANPGIARTFDVMADLLTFGSKSEHLAALTGAAEVAALY